jgi:hypothetical protein
MQQVTLTKEDVNTIEAGIKALTLYHHIMATLPEDIWNAISLGCPVIWRQVEEQSEFLEGILKMGFVPDYEV